MDSSVLRVGAVFDGTAISGPATVHVADGRIAAVENGSGPLPGGARVIDFGDRACLLPGLVDSHVHLAFDASPDPVASLRAVDDAALLERMRQAARRAVRAGITTVRDLGDRSFLALALAEKLAGRPELGPEILAAGPPLTTRRGHCWFLGGETEGTSALRAAVRERHARGCAVVKVMASGGTMTPESVPPHVSQYTAEELRAVVDEAHRLGLPVAAHVHGTDAIRDAVDAGVDSLEHVSFLSADGGAPDSGLIDAVVRSGAFAGLTVGSHPGVEHPLPPAIAAQFETVVAAYRELYVRGARVVVGSDAGIGPFKPHDVLPHAVSALPALGVPAADALRWVTSVAAQACGVGDRKGRIAVGADADLLVVDGDPLADISRIHAVTAVFRAGVRVR